ncbi:hypothetical protein PGT21_024170 [Puccinia graminis f. sp. tritici]|uniref:Uncharacterized protein n=1 Tax=Puccinia graminis f. sp. tritici TaxID=56615 RepID=A0A5B0LUB6_PUCGR|nr:hypothetical protein PGT21_024170 [Puccinia graminis f. sp. tritici]
MLQTPQNDLQSLVEVTQTKSALIGPIQNTQACLALLPSLLFSMILRCFRSLRHFRVIGQLSYYSISSDYSPTQSFDEDGDSFTSFGSIQTPPRLRAMICSIFDGTLNSPIRSFPDSDYGDTGSPHESVTDPIPAAIVAEGLNEALIPPLPFDDYSNTGSPHESVTDPIPAAIVAEGLNKALIPPLPFDGEPMAYSSDQDGEYELDDSTAASTPDTGPDHHPVVDESAIDLNGFHYALDTTNGIARDIGSPNPNEIAVSHIDPSLQLPSGADNQGDIGKKTVPIRSKTLFWIIPSQTQACIHSSEGLERSVYFPPTPKFRQVEGCQCRQPAPPVIVIFHYSSTSCGRFWSSSSNRNSPEHFP